MDRVRTVGKLVFNGLRYRLLKSTGRPGRLEAISLEITHRCICRCRMCNIWQIPSEIPDLALSDWVGLLSSPALGRLVEIDITGGEPFLREDLEELLEWIGHSKSSRFPALKTVAITTNGILTARILDVTARIAGAFQERGIALVLACGMDAVGTPHDDIRQFKGAWEKLSATIERLKELRTSHANLILGIKTTIVPANVHELERIASFAREHDLFALISPCIITGNRFANLDLRENLQFSIEDQRAVRNFFETSTLAWNGHRQTLLDFFETGTVAKPCSAGFNTVFVRHSGEVFPCPVIPSGLGNMRTSRLEQLLTNLPSRHFRQHIGEFPECKVCTEPGLERLAWPFEGFTCLHRLWQLGFKEFSLLARHMGLDKYL